MRLIFNAVEYDIIHHAKSEVTDLIQKKKFNIAIITLLNLLAIVLPMQIAAQPRAHRTIRVHYRGDLPFIQIYMNGRYKGMVKRNAYGDFLVKTGLKYRIQATHSTVSSVKGIYLRRNSTRIHNVRFYEPSTRSGHGHSLRPGRKALLQISYQGTRAWSRIWIDGLPQGKINRFKTRVFDVQTGKSYVIRLAAGGRTITRTIRISNTGRMESITFRTP